MKLSQLHRRDALKLLPASVLPAIGYPMASNASNGPETRSRLPGVYRTRVGEILVTTLYDGEILREVKEGYVRNANLEQLQNALTEAFLPRTHFVNPYTFTAIESAGKTALVDTGTGDLLSPSIDDGLKAMAAAGLSGENIDIVILTHFHPDHVGGLTDSDGQPLFPNAEIRFPTVELEFLQNEEVVSSLPQPMQDFARAARLKLAAYGDAVRTYDHGDVLLPGVSAFATPGHTPGHMAISLTSNDETMVIVGDAITYPAIFVPHPEWHVMFDADGQVAAKTRLDLLERLSSTNARVSGTHFPFPSLGRITRRENGYVYVQDQWSNEV